MSIPATTEEKKNKKNNVKARGLLLMALPNEHQLTFSQYPDDKSMFAAIETRLRVSAASPSVNAASPQVCTASVSDNTMYSFKIENPNGSNVLHQDLEQIHKDDLEAMDLKSQLSLLSVECYNCHKLGHFARECRAPRNKEGQFKNQDNTRKQGNMKIYLHVQMLGYCWSSLMIAVKLNESEFKATTYKRGLATLEDQIITYKKNDVLLEVAVLKREVELDNSKENSDESLVKEQVSQNKSSFVESSLNVDKETVFPVDKKINCDHHQRKRIVSRNNYNKVDYDYYAKTTHPSVHRNMTLRAVLLKTDLTPLNTVRPVNTAHPKPAVHSAKSMSQFSKQAQSTAQRPFYKQTTLTRRFVHTAKRHYYTKRPRAGNTARSYTGPVNVVREKGGKPQQDDTGFVDSGCSRHMTGNIAYLSDFKEFDGGYVTFGGGAHGGRISGKGTLKTDSLDFEDVYFVNELKFNLFSVSQMCDKKNYVLFTDTKCLVLSLNFKLPDESQILLKIPRKDNMYSFDMKNIVPKETLTCLVAKATSDESML
ncbi:ribonuclease H-like domain-containing protein [Tanacetum coccineum]